jgi:diaminopropionate ammonia-lyase
VAVSVVQLLVNPNAHRGKSSAAERRIVSLRSSADALAEILQWPGYSRTPLRRLTSLAASLGVSEVLYKDESARFSLGSFKSLGGAYAAAREVRRMLAARGKLVSLRGLFAGECPEETSAITLCCATDGNHGVSVAFAAKNMGTCCVIFMHEHASQTREAKIRQLGATVHRIAGTYDDSVHVARQQAKVHGWVLVADTSTEPFEQVPAEIIQGYAVMMLEIMEQLEGDHLTHVFLQGGVGGLAAAVAGFLTDKLGALRPTVVVVEPEAAACLLASARLGRAASVGGSLETVMGMLSCGEASSIAWTILNERADFFLTIDDDAAVHTHDLLHRGDAGCPLNVGYSGAAGVAGLIGLMKHKEHREAMRLNAESRILVFGTEIGGINKRGVPLPGER